MPSCSTHRECCMAFAGTKCELMHPIWGLCLGLVSAKCAVCPPLYIPMDYLTGPTAPSWQQLVKHSTCVLIDWLQRCKESHMPGACRALLAHAPCRLRRCLWYPACWHASAGACCRGWRPRRTWRPRWAATHAISSAHSCQHPACAASPSLLLPQAPVGPSAYQITCHGHGDLHTCWGVLSIDSFSARRFQTSAVLICCAGTWRHLLGRTTIQRACQAWAQSSCWTPWTGPARISRQRRCANPEISVWMQNSMLPGACLHSCDACMLRTHRRSFILCDYCHAAT
jgi:hypothetical protein